jgi:hypothetical protein
MKDKNGNNIDKKKDNEIELKYFWNMIDFYATNYEKYKIIKFDMIKKNTKTNKKEKKYLDTDKYDKIIQFARDVYNKHFGYSIPTRDGISEIIKFIGNDCVLEIGAGLGVWTKLLQLNNVEAYAIDDYSEYFGFYENTTLCNVEKLDFKKAISKYNKCDVLMVSWLRDYAEICTDTMNYFKGDKIIFIGEYHPERKVGETRYLMNCNEFDQALRDNFNLIKQIRIYSWIYSIPMVHLDEISENMGEFITLFERKK